MARDLLRPDGSVLPVRGYHYRAPPVGAARFSQDSANVARLPAKVDLRELMSEVEDQQQTSSCAANAAAGAYEYLMKRHLGPDEAYDVSRLFIYYNARAVDGTEAEDGGSVLASVIEGLKQNGACSEDTWPFDPELVNEQPSAEAYDEAKSFLVEGTELVPTDLDAWRTALAAGYPIIFGLKLYDSFDRQKRAGAVPMPTSNETSRESHAGHAMLCVGYSDPDKVFIVRNSWGTGWGDAGYCYIPYRYIISDDHNYGDSWIIRQVDVLDNGESGWSDSDESVLEDASHLLASLSEEEYEAFLEAMGEHPFELRLAALFIAACGADGALEDAELDAIAGFLDPILEQTGGQRQAARILRRAVDFAMDDAFLNESVAIFGQVFPPEVLASVVNQIQEAAATDDLGEDEAAFVDQLVEAWQIPTE